MYLIVFISQDIYSNATIFDVQHCCNNVDLFFITNKIYRAIYGALQLKSTETYGAIILCLLWKSCNGKKIIRIYLFVIFLFIDFIFTKTFVSRRLNNIKIIVHNSSINQGILWWKNEIKTYDLIILQHSFAFIWNK